MGNGKLESSSHISSRFTLCSNLNLAQTQPVASFNYFPHFLLAFQHKLHLMPSAETTERSIPLCFVFMYWVQLWTVCAKNVRDSSFLEVWRTRCVTCSNENAALANLCARSSITLRWQLVHGDDVILCCHQVHLGGQLEMGNTTSRTPFRNTSPVLGAGKTSHIWPYCHFFTKQQACNLSSWKKLQIDCNQALYIWGDLKHASCFQKLWSTVFYTCISVYIFSCNRASAFFNCIISIASLTFKYTWRHFHNTGSGTSEREDDMADTGAGPRDAAVMEAILREMGVEDYEPNVIHQMLEFSYSKWHKCDRIIGCVLRAWVGYISWW